MPTGSLTPDNLPLRDIHLPPAISWWPPAIGWWLLLVGLVLLPVVFYALRQHRRRRHYRALAILRLEGLARQYDAQADARQLLQGLSRLLRQVTLLHYPQDSCAGLVGEAWLSFLDRPLEGEPFSQGIGRLLENGPYLPQAEDIDAKALLAVCRDWLQRLPPAPKPLRRPR